MKCYELLPFDFELFERFERDHSLRRPQAQKIALLRELELRAHLKAT